MACWSSYLHSAGQLLCESELFEHGYHLRRSICYEMDKNREDLVPFIPGSFEAYLAHMSQEGVWGGEVGNILLLISMTELIL